MPQLALGVVLKCGQCSETGEELAGSVRLVSGMFSRSELEVIVMPCQTCLDKARAAGREEGSEA
jgi:hypothetical protein